MLRVAVGFAAGAAAAMAVGVGPAFVPLLVATLPILLLRGLKSPTFSLVLCFAAGLAWAEADARTHRRCTNDLSDGARAEVGGYFLRSSAESASTFRAVSGVGSGCREPTRVYFREGAPMEGELVVVEGQWFATRRANGSKAIYLSASSVRSAPGDVPWRHRLGTAVRRRASDALENRLGAQAGVASALVLAEREGIPQELWDAFARSGSAHLLSISGFHVGVVAALLGAVLSAAGRPPRSRAVGTAVGVWGYVLLIGAPTSATRAAWMTTAFVLGRIRRTPAQALGGLGLSMLMIAILRPSVVSGAGFQLTVTGTAGILILAKWIISVWPAHRGRGWIAPPVAAGIGASIFTAPVLAYHFGQIPLLSLPSSILLTPLVAAAVPGVILTILMDILGVPGAAAVVGAGSEGLLYAVVTVASALGDVPGTVWTATPQEAALLTAGGLLPLALWRAPWRSRPHVRAAAVVLSACAVLWLGQAALSLAGRGRIEVVAIDVGQGDAIAVRTPAGRWLLVDAGPRFGGADAGLTRVVPYLRARGVRRLEAVILTHPDEDHAGGLASVLANVPVGTVLGPGFGGGQSGHMAGLEEARRAGVPWRRVVAGDEWAVDGVSFRVLSPTPEEPEAALRERQPADRTRSPSRERSPNDWSVVLRASYGEFDALLMGDADERIELALLGRPDLRGEGDVELLKVGHHGSSTSTSEEFVDAVSPRYALVSAGARNRYGHPNPEVLARLGRAGTRILRTDRQGTVSVVGRIDGSATARAGRR